MLLASMGEGHRAFRRSHRDAAILLLWAAAAAMLLASMGEGHRAFRRPHRDAAILLLWERRQPRCSWLFRFVGAVRMPYALPPWTAPRTTMRP
jgi:hypothetical protein